MGKKREESHFRCAELKPSKNSSDPNLRTILSHSTVSSKIVTSEMWIARKMADLTNFRMTLTILGVGRIFRKRWRIAKKCSSWWVGTWDFPI